MKLLLHTVAKDGTLQRFDSREEPLLPQGSQLCATAPDYGETVEQCLRSGTFFYQTVPRLVGMELDRISRFDTVIMYYEESQVDGSPNPRYGINKLGELSFRKLGTTEYVLTPSGLEPKPQKP